MIRLNQTRKAYSLHRKLSLLAFLWTIRSYAAVAAFEFSPAFQRRVRCGKRLASRQRRLISGVADATRRLSHTYRGLKPTAKFKCRYRGRKTRAVNVFQVKY